jgi:uncharacterized membrane protein YfcA
LTRRLIIEKRRPPHASDSIAPNLCEGRHLPSAQANRALTGLSSGFFSGLTGVGGGALMVPLFTGPLKLRQHVAHGTSLFVVFFVGISGAITYWIDQGSLEWHLVLGLCAGSLIGAGLGARWMLRVPALTLRALFALMLFAVSIRLIFFPDVGALADPSGWSEWPAAAGIGLIGGLLAGMLGIGGGAVFVPALVLLLGVDQHSAQGVSLAVIVFTAAVGTWQHLRNDNVDLEVARWVTPFAVPASVAGAVVAGRLAGDDLQRIFGVVILLVSLQMLWSTWRRYKRGRVSLALNSAHAAAVGSRATRPGAEAHR